MRNRLKLLYYQILLYLHILVIHLLCNGIHVRGRFGKNNIRLRFLRLRHGYILYNGYHFGSKLSALAWDCSLRFKAGQSIIK